MTEERFWYDFEDVNGHKIVDFKNDKEYPLETIGDFREVVDLLNEQQATITELKEENEQLKQRIALFEQQEDEFEEATAQTIQNMIANYRDD